MRFPAKLVKVPPDAQCMAIEIGLIGSAHALLLFAGIAIEPRGQQIRCSPEYKDRSSTEDCGTVGRCKVNQQTQSNSHHRHPGEIAIDWCAPSQGCLSLSSCLPLQKVFARNPAAHERADNRVHSE